MLSAIALLIGPPLVYTVNYLMRRLRRITRESVEVNSRLIGAMQEATQGIAIVKAFTMEEQLSAQAGGADRPCRGAAPTRSRGSPSGCRRSPRCWPASPLPASSPMPAIARSTATSRPARCSPSSPRCCSPMIRPAGWRARRSTLERSLVNARMIYEILDLEPQPGRRAGRAAAARSASGEVRFDHVSFAYARGTPVLDDVSFTAAAGKTTAIVGGSGAGKSTLIALLQRFYDVDGGSHRDRRPGHRQGHQAVAARLDRLCLAAALSVRRHHPRQHPLWPPRRHRCRDRAGGAKSPQADEFIRQQPHGYDTRGRRKRR